MNNIKKNWLRYLIQWGILLTIILTILIANLQKKPVDPETYCPFGGLQALGSYLQNNSLACSMSMVQIMMGVMLAIGVILFSKLFCGYLCPLGTISEGLGKLGRRWKMHYTIKDESITDKLLRCIKYILLFIIVYFSVRSSELFCKNLDPYYALATGLKGEITVWMTAISIPLLFLGSTFINMFWCKYICPLGGLSNIFKFTFLFVAAVLVLWLLGLAGVANAWVWTLAAVCLIAYIIEIAKKRARFFPLMYIRRDDDKCTKCGVCQKKCPYNIAIEKGAKQIRHIDCTLCTTCIPSCPHQALAVNGRKALRWVPAMKVVALFGLALWMGSSVELPTIDEKWGEWEKIENIQVFEMDGLTTVKCYGSSRSFSAKMQSVQGVYGVKTFVKRHAVVISYNPDEITPEGIQEAIFTRFYRKFRTPEPEIDELKVYKVGIEGLYDRMDLVNFGLMLQNEKYIYGFDSEFACPVEIILYTHPDTDISARELKKIIEVKEITIGNSTRKVNFSVASIERKQEFVSVEKFMLIYFGDIEAQGAKFSKNMEKYGNDAEYPKAIYEMPYVDIEKPLVRRNFPYFRSHLSSQEGILEVRFISKERQPVMQIVYVESMWSDDRIWKGLFNAEKWKIRYNDGETKEEDPKLSFKTPGQTVNE